MFGGDLRAHGFYCRHGRDLRIHETDLGVDEPDSWPAIVLDDVERAHIDGFPADGSADGDGNQARTVNCIGVDCRP